MAHFACFAASCAHNPNCTCPLQLMALLMVHGANYVNRYAHQMGQAGPTDVSSAKMGFWVCGSGGGSSRARYYLQVRRAKRGSQISFERHVSPLQLATTAG